MEVLRPTHPPGTAGDRFGGFSSPWNSPHGFGRTTRTVTPQLPGIVEEFGGRIHVAVGKSLDKTFALLYWTFRQFPGREICLLHVHQPSPLIPTLLGNLPASQANVEVVSAYRREEMDQTEKLLLSYLRICWRSKVKVSIITAEADQVQKEIVGLVNKYAIGMLVMGAVPVNWLKMKKSYGKASYAAKNAPPFCEIWFVTKGKHIWTREASEVSSFVPPINQHETTTATNNLQTRSLRYHNNEVLFDPICLRSSSARITPSSTLGNWFLAGLDQTQLTFSPTKYRSSSPTSADSETMVEEESLCYQLGELKFEAEASRNEVLSDLMKCREFEARALEATHKVKAFESGCAYQLNLRLEAEDTLRTMAEEQRKLLEEREEATKELHKTVRNIAFLNNCVQESNCRREEASEELELIQASIGSLRTEKQKIQRQKIEAEHWRDQWRSRQQALVTDSNAVTELDSNAVSEFEDSFELMDFSLSDLQTATCNFSESFTIGHGGNGCVYKGEMLDRTVAIKKLYPHNIQGQSEFQLEVEVLGKLQHPHLATLVGVCREAMSLVYEYMPNGSLQDCLFRKSNNCSLTWKIRTRIVAEIASALQFLHSFRPEKMVHGNLKPENILLDSALSCKIGDFGICRLVPKEPLLCPSFRRYSEPKGAFLYTDPELHRTGIHTPKSDVYSFGLIILQLLTGRAPTGLPTEVRKVESSGKITSLLDSSAGEWPSFVARKLVKLGLQCCELNGRERPDLTPALVKELEQLYVLEERTVPSFFLCPILQEIMHDPQVAADGFTYEGDAMGEWLENGRETSPMTNLKLRHLRLTPNHALRQAIQDWLCRP